MPPPEGLAQHGPRVLIVSRRESVRDLYGHWFSALRFEVFSAGLHSGVRWVIGRHAINLVVVDVTTDLLFGLAGIRAVRGIAAGRVVPVISLTPTIHDPIVSEAFLAGTTDVFPHLGSVADLQRNVVELLDVARLRGVEPRSI